MPFRLDRYAYLFAAIALLTIVISSCAPVRAVKQPAFTPTEQEEEVAENGWWCARFRVRWPKDTEPSWHVDVFLAHKIVRPVVNRYKDKIMLWRFHRRAVRDESGHQFSFIFYASPLTAQQIYNCFRSDRQLKKMKTAGVIVQNIYDDTTTITKPNIEDTCDRKWSPEIRRSWPYYMTGVSEMWLNLLTEVAERISNGKEPLSVEENQALYKKVNASINEIWMEQGGHAFLHHLSAIFGYEPVIVWEERVTRF